MKQLAALCALLLTACATARNPKQVDVIVDELVATDSWRVTVRHAEPVEAVHFWRGEPFRAGRWKIVSPAGAKWGVREGQDAVVFEQPSRDVVVEFANDTRQLPKDYNINFNFTDGSRLLYIGHLRTGDAPHVWTFRSPRTIRLLDRAGRRELRWPGDVDTYVYFGSIEPVSTPRMTLIVDPGLPQWIREQLEELAPKQFDYFAAKMGVDVEIKPLVLMSYGGAKGSGRSFKGGVLPGLVQLDVEGAGWSTKSRAGEQLWYRRLAHEVFHTWDADQYEPSDDAEWLAEAGAEAFSLDALRDAGLIDEAGRQAMIVDAANACLARYDGKPLPQSNPTNFYSCGLVTQELLRDRLLPVWKGLFVHGRQYTTRDFLDAAQHPAIAELVERGVSREALGPWLARELTAAGIAVRVEGGKLVAN